VLVALLLPLGFFYRAALNLFAGRDMTPPPGAQPPPEKPRPAIAVANAAQVGLVTRLPRDIRKVAWGPITGRIALLGAETPIEVLDADTLALRQTIGAGRPIVNFAFSPDGQTVAWSERNKKAEIRSLGKDQRLVLEPENPEPTVAFSPDGKLLVTGGYGARAEVWDAVTGKAVRRFDSRPEGLLQVGFRPPNGTHLAIGNRNGQTYLYEVATGKLRHTLPRPMSHELKFSPDGNLLAVGYVDGGLGVWDVAGGDLLRSRATGAEIFSLDWSRTGNVLATGSQTGTITLWDPRDLSVLKELNAGDRVTAVRFNPDGSRLLAATGREIQVWGLPPGGGD
jgi:WD40 repeat protein